MLAACVLLLRLAFFRRPYMCILGANVNHVLRTQTPANMHAHGAGPTLACQIRDTLLQHLLRKNQNMHRMRESAISANSRQNIT